MVDCVIGLTFLSSKMLNSPDKQNNLKLVTNCSHANTNWKVDVNLL